MDAVANQRLGEGVLGKNIYHYVYADSKQRFTNAFGSRRPIRYGDRLFARLVRHGRTILEFVVSEVCDFTEFMGELRKKAQGLKGLVQLQVRNYSRGWSLEQPLMLYAPQSSPTFTSYSAPSSSSFSPSLNLHPCNSGSSSTSRMPFPWETH